jgi:hypothetical protein
MGEIEAARVDVRAVLEVAGRYDAVADIVDGLVRTHLARLSFDGSVAGRDHAARGDAQRRAVDGVIDQMHAWARAVREIAAALRSSGVRYVEVDARGAARMG